MSEAVKPKTYVALVLDRSSSMSGTKKETIVGYNEYVQQMKINSQTQDVFVSLITFNGDVFEHLLNVNAGELVEATAEDYVPQGSTAYYDAVGYTIDRLSSTVAQDDNNAYLIVVISDGEDNSSKHFSSSSLKAKIEEKKATGKWTFTFMGCNEDQLIRVARETGIPISNMAAWDNSSASGTKKSLVRSRKKLGAYLDARSMGEVTSDCYYSNLSDCSADLDDDSDASNIALDAINNFSTSSLDTSSINTVTSAGVVNNGINASIANACTNTVSMGRADYFKTTTPVSWKS